MPEKSVKPVKKIKPETEVDESGELYQRRGKSFPVVALGGSAGAFASFKAFFTHMPAESGMAFVIIIHLDPNHKGQVADLIKTFTAMPVVEAVDGMQLEENKVYIIPANKDMGLHNRQLLLLQPAITHGYRQPIDYFLQSLADDQWNRAVGIIFSGMGSDGETGVRMVKEKLGMVMVQDPQTAQYNSMPLAAISTNLVDYVLSPEEMPVKLIQYLNHPVLAEEASEQVKQAIQDSNAVQKILMLLRSHTGHDFSLYKKSTINRRIDRRIAYHQIPDYATYVTFLRENPQETDVLFNELLIGVTKFFRDVFAFESLKLQFNTLVKQKKRNETVRVWVTGCSTGEEAYSIAILLMESLEEVDKHDWPKLQLFATDLDSEAIDHARSGIYYSNIAADVSPERLEKYFIGNENTYQVKKELREMIVFAQHNLIKDAPFTRLDLLSCRNVMIYLTTELQRKIIPVFHYAIIPHGLMFMGPAETIGGFTDMFTSVDPKWKIYERKEGSASVGRMIDFPFNVSRHLPAAGIKLDDLDKIATKRSVADTFNKILLENFTPAAVLVNEKGDILYSNGKTGRFLELPHGEAVMNIHKMAREELRYVIGNIIHQARSQKGQVNIEDIKIREGNQLRLISLKATLLEDTGLHGLVLLAFDDKGLSKKNRKTIAAGGQKDQVTEELEKELVYTKQRLNNTIEQMETSVEELKSTNEELQSTNEELQSTNEESLTTKEEMQSLNEELMTINMQYQSKTDELTRINNDMKNLLDSTEIGTIFLDNNLDILRYTPQVRRLFNLIPTDVGRPILHVVSNFDNTSIENDIKEVIEKLLNKELEVKTKNGEWYKVRIMPYRTLDNFISGAVITFTLITEYKNMEQKLELVQQFAGKVIDIPGVPILLAGPDQKIINVNKAGRELLNGHNDGILGKSVISFLNGSFRDAAQVKRLTAFIKNTGTEPAELVINGKNYQIYARKIKSQDETGEMLTMITLVKTA
ncbi:two-component system, chemotaxis family, CheB/CheR fusion protein [Mucilaginibacter pineti]|uniref:protein-glutamate O-methyltransferase n=1 Tax=Mucilaginibacter pineti TaxID=1391627 RepID=A0A1G7H6U1_9SPHI|nr:CheR family methyltransferase [Mucilaginibacter pineti]SDE96091.1 two-component system, chemotaxis family, CheB/CheR fusion protein [Mucilaginibacter pineti]